MLETMGLHELPLSEREQEGEIVEPMKMVSIPLLSLTAIIPKNGKTCHSSIAASGNEKKHWWVSVSSTDIGWVRTANPVRMRAGAGQNDGGRRGKNITRP
jgi:hypothetical protein